MYFYKVVVSYNGAYFKGFQKQPNKETVQGKIEQSLSLLTKKFDFTYSGRTDVGVHARNQILCLETDKLFNEKLIHSFDQLLGNNILVKSFNKIPKKFDARFDAVERTYKYFIANHLMLDPYKQSFILGSKVDVNLSELNRAAKLFLGSHNFSSFAKLDINQNPIRTITRSSWLKRNDIFEYTISGNSFLRNMVRNIVGVQIALLEEKLKFKDVKDKLSNPEGNRLNYIAPAKALILWKVKY